MKSAEKARNNGLYRHIRTSKEIIRNLLNDYNKHIIFIVVWLIYSISQWSKTINLIYRVYKCEVLPKS